MKNYLASLREKYKKSPLSQEPKPFSKGTKRGILIVFIIFVLYGISQLDKSSQEQAWISYDSPSGFHISFPDQPEATTWEAPIENTGEIMDVTKYVSVDQNGTAYVVVIHHSPDREIEGVSENMEQLRSFLTYSSAGSEVSLTETTFQNEEAIDYKFKYTDSGDDFYVQGKVFERFGSIYNLCVIYDPALYKSEDYEKFINSFEIKNI